jgi:hypothetical protein
VITGSQEDSHAGDGSAFSDRLSLNDDQASGRSGTMGDVRHRQVFINHPSSCCGHRVFRFFKQVIGQACSNSWTTIIDFGFNR